VVRAELQAQDAVHLVVARGNEDDRSPVAARAERPAELEPVHPWDADVQHDRRRTQSRDRLERADAVRLDVDAEPAVAEVEPFEVGDGRLVLDDEHQALLLAHLPILADWARHPAHFRQALPFLYSAFSRPERGRHPLACMASLHFPRRSPGRTPLRSRLGGTRALALGAAA